MRGRSGSSISAPPETSSVDLGVRRPVGVRRHDLLEHRQRTRAPERDDLAARLELAEEEHVVDQVARRLDLLARLVDELLDVGAGQRRGLEQDEQPRERRAKLVRDGGREAGAQLLVGGELGQVADEEHERAADVLADPAAGHGLAERGDGGRARRDEPPLAGRARRRAPPERPRAPVRAPRPLPPLHHPFTFHRPAGDTPRLDNDTRCRRC